MIRSLIISCFLFLCSCEKERVLASSESVYFLKLQDEQGIVFVEGKVIHIGNDFVAYGKYEIDDLFDKNKFISTNQLVKSRLDRRPYFPENASSVHWFVINPDMEIFEKNDGRKADLTIWIDRMNSHIFVESIKW